MACLENSLFDLKFSLDLAMHSEMSLPFFLSNLFVVLDIQQSWIRTRNTRSKLLYRTSTSRKALAIISRYQTDAYLPMVPLDYFITCVQDSNPALIYTATTSPPSSHFHGAKRLRGALFVRSEGRALPQWSFRTTGAWTRLTCLSKGNY